MITRANELTKTAPENLRGGNGVINMIHFLNPEDSYDTGRMFSVSTLPPGASIGKHIHQNEFEIYYVLKGTVTVNVTDNDRPDVMHAGDCMICRDGDTHSIENKSDQDAEVLFVVLFTKKS